MVNYEIFEDLSNKYGFIEILFLLLVVIFACFDRV